ncbi:MAG TPA: DUF3298 domain-containing protein [Candidatus Paceibacterota bacterium]
MKFINKIKINETLLMGATVFILLVTTIYFGSLPKTETDNEITDLNSDLYIPVSEYIPVDATYAAERAFRDGAVLGIMTVSPEQGLRTEIARYPVLTWETYKIVENKGRVNINIEYPHFLGNKNSDKVVGLNQYIETLIQNALENDRKLLKLMVRDDPDSFESIIALSVVYRLIGVINGIVSLEIVISDFTGGGLGNHDKPITINWDLKSNKLLTADQVFCPKNYTELLLPLVQKQLFKKLHPGNVLVNDWATPEEYNWEYFLLKKDGIIAVFPPYDVSSGADGIVRVLIPNSSISNLLCLP